MRSGRQGLPQGRHTAQPPCACDAAVRWPRATRTHLETDVGLGDVGGQAHVIHGAEQRLDGRQVELWRKERINGTDAGRSLRIVVVTTTRRALRRLYATRRAPAAVDRSVHPYRCPTLAALPTNEASPAPHPGLKSRGELAQELALIDDGHQDAACARACVGGKSALGRGSDGWVAGHGGPCVVAAVAGATAATAAQQRRQPPVLTTQLCVVDAQAKVNVRGRRWRRGGDAGAKACCHLLPLLGVEKDGGLGQGEGWGCGNAERQRVAQRHSAAMRHGVPRPLARVGAAL